MGGARLLLLQQLMLQLEPELRVLHLESLTQKQQVKLALAAAAAPPKNAGALQSTSACPPQTLTLAPPPGLSPPAAAVPRNSGENLREGITLLTAQVDGRQCERADWRVRDFR